MKSPIVLLRHLLTDVSRLMPGVKGLERDLITLENRFEHEGDSFLTITLCDFGDSFFKGIEDGHWTLPTSFKRKGALPLFLSGLTCLVFDNCGCILESPCVESILTIRQITYFFKKMAVSDDVGLKLHAEAIESFVSTDSLLAKIKFDARKEFVLRRIAWFCLFPEFKLEEQDFKHGPGGVYERAKGNAKWRDLYTQLADSYSSQRIGFDLFVTKAMRVDPDDFHTPYGGTSRLVTVPKTAKAARMITVEPLLNQFIQQGINGWLRRTISKSRILNLCLDLTDQEPNKKMALDGSLSRLWTTIDLKSASDLLSTKLVKVVFGQNKELCSSLMSSRSSCAEGDMIIPLHKYAGMGNATTFPVQSICFALICIAAILDDRGLNATYWNVQQAASSVRVFGDDIIVPTEHFTTVRAWLMSFGLIVNDRKTFTKSNFRESCGCDAYGGVDITPTYIRFDPRNLKSSETTSILASLVSSSNQLWEKGYYSTSTALVTHIEQTLKRRLPLVRKESRLLGIHSRTNATEAHGWDSKLHTLRVRGLVVLPFKEDDNLGGYGALLKFFNTSLIERRGDHLKSSVVRFKTRTAQRWVPA